MQKSNSKKAIRKPQHQTRPGIQSKMSPLPKVEKNEVTASNKLLGRTAIITGGDSGIGKAVSLLYAKEGADIAIIYLNEDSDANDTKKLIEEKYGRQCMLVKGDISKETFCIKAVRRIGKAFKNIHVLVNNAAVHYESKGIENITTPHLLKTFYTNTFSMFWITKEALPYMVEGSAIINTTSVTAYRGSAELIDYAATKGAIIAFTRSLAASLVDKGIRVNAVAPGPVWTPLIASSFKGSKVASFGSEVPMKRAGEPAEIAPCYLFLASDDASYMTGQVLHPNGGEIING